MTNGFDLGHDLDILIFKVICDPDHLVTKVRCKDLPDSDRGDFRCRRAVDSSSLVSYICGMIRHMLLYRHAIRLPNFPDIPYTILCLNYDCNSLNISRFFFTKPLYLHC